MSTNVTTQTAITKAFKQLRKEGFAARENYMCCQGCGLAAIQEKYPKAIAYVFWHQQDNDDAMEGRNFHLAFGHKVKGTDDRWVENETLSTLIGHHIVATLKAHGVETIWDGTNRTRIEVVNK